MNFEKCVQFLKENFENIEINKIEEEVSLYLIKKSETCEILDERNYEIDDNSLIELMEILSKLGNDKGDISIVSTKRESKENFNNEYLLDNYENISKEVDFSIEYSKVLNNEKNFNINNKIDPLKDISNVDIIENSNYEKNAEVSDNIDDQCNYRSVSKQDSNNYNRRINLVKDNKNNINNNNCTNNNNNADNNNNNADNNNNNNANNNNNLIIKEKDYEHLKDIMINDNINAQKKEKENNFEVEGIQYIKNKEIDNIPNHLQNEEKSLESIKSEKKNITVIEILFSKSLLDNENIKQNISAKNFYIVDEDMLINIILILDRIISQLIIYYNEKKLGIDEQNSHFQSFFKILYKLLSNISFHANEEKYRTIKLSNNQVKSSFLINADIFNLVKLLFEILNFNTNYSNNSNKEDSKKLDKAYSSSEYSNIIWKFESSFSDKESILFEFVLSSIKIIMSTINKNTENKWNNTEKSEPDNKTQLVNKNNHNTKLFVEQKRELEKLYNKSTPLFNNKILQIHQKNKEEEQALCDIRKLHNERYKVHKICENNESSDKYKKSNNKKMWIFNKKNENSKDSFFLNEELDEKKKLKSKKKLKHFLKKLFKKD